METQQARTLRLFTALRLLRADWGGALLVGVGLGEAGRALALASLAAGAASLFLEEDGTSLRTATREGCCTFSVTTLDEALRALKNEVRQRRAISVALKGSAAAVLQQMIERGVQPDYMGTSYRLDAAETAAIGTLQVRGAQTVAGCGLSQLAGSVALDSVLASQCAGWQIEADIVASVPFRRAQDAALLGEIREGGPVAAIRRDWLQAAPLLFPRALERAVWRSEVV